MDSVTAEDAHEIARQCLIEQAKNTTFKVVDGDHWPSFRLLPWVCIGNDTFPNGSWVVYLMPESVELNGHFIVVVDKSSGEILYSGSAYDAC